MVPSATRATGWRHPRRTISAVSWHRTIQVIEIERDGLEPIRLPCAESESSEEIGRGLQKALAPAHHPESVPVNLLIRVPGTPLADQPDFPGLELVRTIAAARLTMPASVVRLSAGRASMSDELHALCLHAGANSIFLGDRLLTADNHGDDADRDVLEQLDTALRA